MVLVGRRKQQHHEMVLIPSNTIILRGTFHAEKKNHATLACLKLKKRNVE
jgi:hypothetical protein